jgi:nucleoside-diphosphate-sugar epimerase
MRAVAREELPAGIAEPYDFAHDLVADTGRIRRELGYSERVGLEEAIAASVVWERAHSIESERFE